MNPAELLPQVYWLELRKLAAAKLASEKLSGAKRSTQPPWYTRPS